MEVTSRRPGGGRRSKPAEGAHAARCQTYYQRNRERLLAKAKDRHLKDRGASLERMREYHWRKKAWIPVADRLPQKDAVVLMAVEVEEGENVWAGWHDDEGWFTMDGTEVDVTHWMPLPKAP
jgi:uncharacterized protein DUF551